VEAYGFSIGMTKKQVYEAAKIQYENKTIYMLKLMDANGSDNTSHRQADFSAGQFDQIKSRDLWEFYFRKHFRNMLRLTFEDGKLAIIYRHRLFIEFP